LQLLLGGRFRRWNGANIASLQRIRHLLTSENRDVLDGFVRLRDAPVMERLRLLRRTGIYRQTTTGSLALYAAALLKLL
jgi:hypothetical protein